MEYIDVRGPWPVLFIGMKAYELVGQDRSITVEEAKKLIAEKEKDNDTVSE